MQWYIKLQYNGWKLTELEFKLQILLGLVKTAGLIIKGIIN